MIMVTSEEAVKLAVVAAASILFVALLLLTNYHRQYWCRQTKPSLIWYCTQCVRFPPQLWEPPTSNTGCHNNFAYQLQKSKGIIAITNMMASNQQAAP